MSLINDQTMPRCTADIYQVLADPEIILQAIEIDSYKVGCEQDQLQQL